MGRGIASKIDDVQFVTAYAKAKSLDQLASDLGIAKPTLQVRASKLRKLGVKLPKFSKPKKVVDVEKLNAILTKFGATGDSGKTRKKK
jgi:hypothetical protein